MWDGWGGDRFVLAYLSEYMAAITLSMMTYDQVRLMPEKSAGLIMMRVLELVVDAEI
jgi:hypothetical protein